MHDSDYLQDIGYDWEGAPGGPLYRTEAEAQAAYDAAILEGPPDAQWDRIMRKESAMYQFRAADLGPDGVIRAEVAASIPDETIEAYYKRLVREGVITFGACLSCGNYIGAEWADYDGPSHGYQCSDCPADR